MMKRWLLAGLAAVSLVTNVPAVCAQGYPSRPIRLVVGFGAGGGTDLLARAYAQKLQTVLNTPVVVENKPGALQLMAARTVMAAAPDGYTLWLATSSALVQSPGVREDLPYDPLKSFTYIAQLAEIGGVFVVRQGLPVNSLKELIAYARAHPGKLNYGSAGVGAANHLLTEYVKQATGTEMVHIPYKSDAEVVHELIGGAIDFAVVGSGSVVQFVNDRKVKPLAVAGSRRTKLLPDVPLASESDVNELKALGSYVFYGLVGPAGMSAAVVRTLGDAVEKAGRMPETVQQFEKLYINPSTASAAEFRARTEKELVIWRGVGENLKGAS